MICAWESKFGLLVSIYCVYFYKRFIHNIVVQGIVFYCHVMREDAIGQMNVILALLEWLVMDIDRLSHIMIRGLSAVFHMI